MLSDARSALRLFRRRPAFCLAAIVTLALGAGANTAAFNVVYRVLLRPLPFRDPARLVMLWEATPALPQLQVSQPDFEDWRKQSHSFEAVSAYTFQAINQVTVLSADQDPEQVHAVDATADLFDTMGIRPIVGRAFTSEEDRTQQSVAMIGERLWRRRFAADPNIAGKSLRIENHVFTIAGVIPSAQAFPEWAEVWMPYSWIDPAMRTTRRFHPLEVIARLKPGVDEAAAREEIQAISKNLARAYPETNGNVASYTMPLALAIEGDSRPALLLVWAAVGLVLVITCANLAHLMLARVLDRQREMSVRTALGANRAGLARLVIFEGIAIAIPGGALGGLLAVAANAALQRIAQGQIPHLDETGFAPETWWFAAGTALLCGIVIALPSCWQIFRMETDLGVRGRQLEVRRKTGFAKALVFTQAVLALAVLSGADLLVRSFRGVMREQPGYQPQHVLAVDVPLPSEIFNGAQAEQFFRQRAFPALRTLPGVEDVAAANSAPMTLGATEQSRFATRFGVEGHTYEAGKFPVAQTRWVTPEYFRTLNIPVVQGRALNQNDLGAPRYMINETLAKKYYPGLDPTTRHLMMNMTQRKPDALEIVGVASDVREMGLDQAPPPMVYTIGSSPRMTLLVKTAGDPHVAIEQVRAAIHVLNPEVAVPAAKSLDDYMAVSVARRRFTMSLLGALALLAAALTAAGIHGLFAYSVSARTGEMGIRAALGAAPANLRGMILRESAMVMLPAVVAGCLPALGFSRLMKGMLYGVSPLDPVSLAAAGVLLVVIAFLSSWLPARRAARVDPCVALRTD